MSIIESGGLSTLVHTSRDTFQLIPAAHECISPMACQSGAPQCALCQLDWQPIGAFPERTFPRKAGRFAKCPKCDGKMKIHQAVFDPRRITARLAVKLAHDGSPRPGATPSLTRSPPHASKLRPRVIDEPRALARPTPHVFDALGQRMLAIYSI